MKNISVTCSEWRYKQVVSSFIMAILPQKNILFYKGELIKHLMQKRVNYPVIWYNLSLIRPFIIPKDANRPGLCRIIVTGEWPKYGVTAVLLRIKKTNFADISILAIIRSRMLAHIVLSDAKHKHHFTFIFSFIRSNVTAIHFRR